MVYRIGLIGCGGIAGAWIKAIAAEEDALLALTFDLSREAAERRAAETGAESVAVLDQIWDSDDVNIVVIGTPTASHPELVEQAARAGKHIMCEKPMALDLDACRRMIAAAEAAGVKLAIGHTLRFMGAFLTCRRLVAEGAIGAPVSGSVDRMGTVGPRRVGSSLSGLIRLFDLTRARTPLLRSAVRGECNERWAARDGRWHSGQSG